MPYLTQCGQLPSLKSQLGTSGAALITSKSGYGYIPLNPGGVLTKSSIPASNIRVLNP